MNMKAPYPGSAITQVSPQLGADGIMAGHGFARQFLCSRHAVVCQ